MFVLRNVGKLIFGSGAQESLIELPQGQLYLVRPLSPKGYSELIFKDAAIRIRRTNQDFHYQLVVQRGEARVKVVRVEAGDDADHHAHFFRHDAREFKLGVRQRVDFAVLPVGADDAEVVLLSTAFGCKDSLHAALCAGEKGIAHVDRNDDKSSIFEDSKGLRCVLGHVGEPA
ncbi:hypothetical protein NLG97_g10202 [Lecanicillium saksenae]|uniref:Uncharacterized protein n=1 Tax=Lecanicillium saksenae TaxID=468837 RepID=A0ACC1QDV5_9HYPO|nr:hypothetical protein NLG97_g10202 [Lecanicillium saksenae]